MFFSLFLVFIDIFSAIVLRASIYKSSLILSKINFFYKKDDTDNVHLSKTERDIVMTEFWEENFRDKREMWGWEPVDSALATAKLFLEKGFKQILIPGFGYGRR